MKVYKMNDMEWGASNLSAEETNEWYKKEFCLGEDELDEPQEVDLDAEGMWIEYENEQHIHELEKENILEVQDEISKRTPGDLWKRGGVWHIYISFREALEFFNFTEESEPILIASTEW